MTLQNLIFVLGGAASGKSALSEKLCLHSGRPRVYVATAEAGDDEMARKIEAHRDQRGPSWETVEAPGTLSGPLSKIEPEKIVLVDCATMWLSNFLAAGGDPAVAPGTLVEELAACPSRLVVVSNELGQGIVPADRDTRRFREAHGRVNQALAAEADTVVMAVAGLPLVLKGGLPQGFVP